MTSLIILLQAAANMAWGYLGAAIGAAVKGETEGLEDKAADAAAKLDAAVYGDRTELEQKADAAIAAVK